jgi:hypothetical protein
MIAKRPFPLKRRSVLTVTMVLSLIAALILVIASPFALETLARSRRDWSQLSNIGQTYGAVSALLSSLALAGVAISLLYQARDSQTAHEDVSRRFQHELLKMELEDVSLMNAFGAPYGLPISADFTSIRQFLFVHMWVSYLAGNYAIGESSKSAIRTFAANELFRSKAGRGYWDAVGEVQLRDSIGRRNHFFRVLDDEYKKAISNNVPVNDPVTTGNLSIAPSGPLDIRKRRAQLISIVVASTVIGAFAQRFWHRSGNS